jgi:flavin-dependent dehydrogenase
LARWQDRIVLNMGNIKPGYAWLFPKSDHLSIGIGGLKKSAKHLKEYYYEFLNTLDINNYEIISMKGSIIPSCTGQTQVIKGRTLLIGDAAGLADPLTGEGIYNAILSARLAAGEIKRVLASNSSDLNGYSKDIQESILKQMKNAYLFSRILGLVPHNLFKLLEKDERVWNSCCKLLRGESDYCLIMERINTLGGIHKFIFR